jgi:hypothetical protein
MVKVNVRAVLDLSVPEVVPVTKPGVVIDGLQTITRQIKTFPMQRHRELDCFSFIHREAVARLFFYQSDQSSPHLNGSW